MRTEQEMTGLILRTAREDERIRAVWMNGSRANPNARRDRYMDFDIVYAVTAVAPYRSREWLARFGEICVMQDPDVLLPEEDYRAGLRQTWLMQFMDGTRIDLTVLRLDEAASRYGAESQTVLLLDKDSRYPPMEASDRDFWLTPPDAGCFAACCNEFWWVAPYAAKGLARAAENPGELLYARRMLEECVRPQLDRMLGWWIGAEEGFSRSLGKCMKELPAYLSAEDWARYLETFPVCAAAPVARALRAACGLFEENAARVAGAFGFAQNLTEARNSRAYIQNLISANAE